MIPTHQKTIGLRKSDEEAGSPPFTLSQAEESPLSVLSARLSASADILSDRCLLDAGPGLSFHRSVAADAMLSFDLEDFSAERFAFKRMYICTLHVYKH